MNYAVEILEGKIKSTSEIIDSYTRSVDNNKAVICADEQSIVEYKIKLAELKAALEKLK